MFLKRCVVDVPVAPNSTATNETSSDGIPSLFGISPLIWISVVAGVGVSPFCLFVIIYLWI